MERFIKEKRIFVLFLKQRRQKSATEYPTAEKPIEKPDPTPTPRSKSLTQHQKNPVETKKN